MAIAQQKLISVHFHNLKGLKDVKVTIKENGLTGFFGTNGSGKSTIIHAIAAIYKGLSENHVMSQYFTPTTNGKWQGSKFVVEYSHINPPTQKNIQVFNRVYKKDIQRWTPEYGRRVEREVRYIGINSCVPEIETETQLSLIHFNIQNQNDASSTKLLDKMSFVMNKRYENHTLNTSWKKTYIGVESNGIVYSALSMGAGEQRIYRILKTVLLAPKYTLILIDEIDLLLHTSALIKLFTVLIEEAKSKSLQIIFTSHRQEILDIKEVDCKHIFQTGQKTLCFENTTPECIARLTDIPEKVLEIFVEDDLSETIVTKIIEEFSINQYVSINRFGAAINAFTLAAGLLLSGRSLDNTLIVLDGDVFDTLETKEKQIKNILTGDDPKAIDSRDKMLESICQYSLPAKTPPEQFLHQILINTDSNDEITQIAKSIQAVNNTHDYLNKIIQRLGKSKDVGLYMIIDKLSSSNDWVDFIAPVKKRISDLRVKNNL